jgi:hypothetical protein
MHTAITSVSPRYGHVKASSQEFKSVSVSVITVLIIFQCHNSKMVFVRRNTRSLTDQVKSSFWLVWLAYKGLRAIGKGANFSTDRLVVLVIKGSVCIIIWDQTMLKYFTGTTFFCKTCLFLLLSLSTQKFFFIDSQNNTEYCIILSTILRCPIRNIKAKWSQKMHAVFRFHRSYFLNQWLANYGPRARPGPVKGSIRPPTWCLIWRMKRRIKQNK